MRRNRAPVKLLLALVALALAGWFTWVSIEFYDEVEESGWSVAALRNPYLAAREFVTRSGIEVTDVDSLARLDELTSVGTLFFSDANQVQTPRQLEQVLDWLGAGGNVIYTASSVAHGEDLLLDEFEVEVDWRAYDADENDADDRSVSETLREYNRQIEQGKSREEIAASLGREEIALTRIEFDGDIGTIDAAFDNSRILLHAYVADADHDRGKHQPFSWAYSEHGVHMMQFEFGSGLLTIISDPTIWTSYRIDQHDHAYLLWLLSSTEGDFAMLRAVLRASVWELIRNNASELLAAAALLLLLWIWRSGQRFGPLQAQDVTRRRALAEHFSTVAHYLWHRGHGARLLQPLRQRVQRRAALVLGEFSRAAPERQYQLLAERADVNAAAVARAFERDDFNDSTFVQTVRLLKRIEQML